MGNKIQKVYLAIPHTGNSVSGSLLQFVCALKELDRRLDNDFEFTVDADVNGFFPVSHARNVCVGKFLRTDCDKLWFMDADMVPLATSLRLLAHDFDICAGRMHRFDHHNPKSGIQPGVKLCAMMRTPENMYAPLVPMPGDPLVQEVDAVGTGSMVIRREVLEDERMRLPTAWVDRQGKERCSLEDWKSGESDAYPIFEMPLRPTGQAIIGEDLWFCERAKEFGYRVGVDLGAEIHHMKNINIDQAAEMALNAVRTVLDGVKNNEPSKARVVKEPVPASNGGGRVQGPVC